MENPVNAVKMDDLGVYPLKKRRKPPSGETCSSCSSFELVVGAFPILKTKNQTPLALLKFGITATPVIFIRKYLLSGNVTSIWKNTMLNGPISRRTIYKIAM